VSLASGARLGPYEVVATIGAGGMGEVLRARDTRLGREVAIKVLPAAFALDAERVARFRREAQILASLNHPNIAVIHGLEESEGTLALVMELVDGDDLAQRLQRGAIPVDETIAIARQIAEALEEAHEKGIVHRDLKPANVKVTSEGKVKVLDFGLAKAFAADPMASSGSHDLSQSPTLAGAGTMAGVILGTAAYMSPEQAKGKPTDRRTDVWAFGCVLFELLSGARAFAGEDVSDTLAAVLRGEPDWSKLPARTPAPIERLLRRCLQKDRRQRVPDIAVVRYEIDEWLAGRGASPVTAPGVPGSGRRTALVAGVAATLGATAATALLYPALRPTPAPQRIARFEVQPPAATTVRTRAAGPGIDVVVSADGSRVVFRIVGPVQGEVLAVHDLATNATAPVPGTAGGNSFSLSPDGATLAFHASGKLQVQVLGTGAARTVANVLSAPDGTRWLDADTIVFAQGKLFRVKAAGGAPEVVAEPAADEPGARFLYPDVVAGGRALLYTVEAGGARRIEARVLATGDVTRVVDDASFPRATASGHLVFLKAGRPVAARFDAAALRLTGEPVPIEEKLGAEKTRGAANFDVAADGTFVALDGDSTHAGRFVWRSRTGALLAAVGTEDLEYLRYPRLSHDGRRLAATVGGANQGQLWLFDLVGTAPPVKLTFEGHNTFPMWTPDDRALVFWSSQAEQRGRLFETDGRILNRMPADGSQLTPQELGRMPGQAYGALSPDGRSVLYLTSTPDTQLDLTLLNLGSGQPPKPWVAERFSEVGPAFSPDGRWVAYQSDQTGEFEVWVRPFPGPGAPVRASAAGGQEPLWSRDGRELFFQRLHKLVAVPVTVRDGALALGAERVLFEGGFVPFELGVPRTYDVAADGRFLMIEEKPVANPATVTVVVGWGEWLAKRVK
jgi:serine/threonine-protein kinase